jgi:hypothetical protein
MPICKLCRTKEAIKQSHVIPKFVIKWLKETGSDYFRRPVVPNIKYQDLFKMSLLCEDCENIFSKYENYFSAQIFHPYLEVQPNQLSYCDKLHYFLVSILWRILVINLDQDSPSIKVFDNKLKLVEKEWRNYLLSQQKTIEKDIHLFITDILSNFKVPVKKFNLYMARGIDATIAVSRNDCLIYGKFARFCIFCYITPYDSSKWINTKIINGDGIISIPQKILDGRIGEFLVNRVRQVMSAYHQGLSERQREKIVKHQKNILPKIIESDMGRALFMDSFSSVDKLFFPKSKIGRNENCHCGSGIKYKKCCYDKQ